MWIFIEKRKGYYFWKLTLQDETFIYNVTLDKNQPTNESGYYSYGYLLKVKGVISGVTLTSLFANL